VLNNIQIDKNIEECMDQLLVIEIDEILMEIETIENDNYKCDQCDAKMGEYCPCL
jgi:hypothetical protein